MIKIILVACALSVTSILGGCATRNADGTSSQPDISAIISQVQTYCRAACGFVPTAATIANIVSGGNPGVMAATAISEAICKALAPVPMGAGRKSFVAKSVKGWRVSPGAVNGVMIQGDRA